MKGFRFVRVRGELIAFGGQVFEGDDELLFRLRGGRWVQRVADH